MFSGSDHDPIHLIRLRNYPIFLIDPFILDRFSSESGQSRQLFDQVGPEI